MVAIISEKILLAFWERLHQVRQLSFNVKSKSKQELGWTGKGKGEVVVQKQSDRVMIYNEKGIWLNKQRDQVNFTNVFRWTLDLQQEVISLEHLRHGANLPVFLFNLAPTYTNSLSSVDSHLCKEDSYSAQIHLDSNSFRLNWKVIGPKKNEKIDYYYSW